MNKIGIFCAIFAGLFLPAAPKLNAQDAWRGIVMRNESGKPIPTLKAIAIPATAECNGKKMKAYVVLWGHVKKNGIGYPTFAIFVDNLREIIPPRELAGFDGPDLSDAVLKSKTIEISITSKQTTKTISSRVLLGDSISFPADIRGKSEDFFDMGVWPTKRDETAWKQLIVEITSSGFDVGHLTIGGPVFSHKLNVEFSGKGIEPLLKELILAVGP